MPFGLKFKIPGIGGKAAAAAKSVAAKPKIIPGYPIGGLNSVGKRPTQMYGSLKELRKANKPPGMMGKLKSRIQQMGAPKPSKTATPRLKPPKP